MATKFEMSMMGDMSFFLGLQVKQTEEGIFISQTKYIREMLKRSEIDKAKEINSPMGTSQKLENDESGNSVDQKLYRGVIGSLLYLTASRLDIVFTICLCARFQANLKESHLTAVKIIFRYLKGTQILGLWYPKSGVIDLCGYSDANFEGCRIVRKSTSGTCQFLGHFCVSWHNKKQTSIALFIVEVEYMVVGSYYAQVLRMK